MKPIRIMRMRKTGGGAPVETTYLSSTTVTAPSAGTYAIYAWGGGAGSRTQLAATAYGAGGGACSIKNALAVTAGQQVVITIGAGGVGTSGAFGAGGDTTVQSPSGTTVCMAKGAAGSTGGVIATGVGDVKYAGGNGGQSVSGLDSESIQYYAWGGGGGAAGSGGIGNNGTPGTFSVDTATDGTGGAGGTGTYQGGQGGTKNIVAGATPGGGAPGQSTPGAPGKVVLVFTPS